MDTLSTAEKRKRLVFALLIWVGTLALFLIIGVTIGSMVGGVLTEYIHSLSAVSHMFKYIGVLLGVTAWATLWARYLDYFVVSVPEVTGLVTINWFDGELRAHGTGIHFLYPWEQVKEGNFINLRIITKTSVEDFPSKDGPLIHVKWSIQYRAVLEQLSRYIAVDESTINDGFHEVGSAALSHDIGTRKAIDIKQKKNANQEVLQERLRHAFENATVPDGDGVETPLEKLYGVDLLVVSLADVDYEESFQRVRASEQISARINTMARKMVQEAERRGSPISFKDALNTALIIDGRVVKKVQEVEGQGINALAGMFMAAAESIGAGKEGKK